MARPGIVLYTEAHRITGHVNPMGRRLSDYLNDPNSDHLEIAQGTWQELLTEDATPQPTGSLTLRKDAVQLVIPMDMTDLAARVATLRMQVEVVVALFCIWGTIHRRPSDPSNLVPLLAGYSRQFVPMSEASIRYLPNGSFDTSASVVLVNTQQVRFWSTRV